ncbi:MAG: PQQ-binding-like beta-propeller repeat protein [Planctomycetota bacterium]|nr:MAG: PQQ-binding-like beta-propeller repeat protein [Planctomycetota bacterium]
MKFARAITILAAAIVAPNGLALQLQADDWPQWRGFHRDGIWRETSILERFDRTELQPRWRTPINPGYAGPAVANGKVYVTDRNRKKNTERVLCLNADTGKIIWTHEYPCPYKGVQYDSGPRCTPTVCKGVIYTLGTMGHLFCLNAETGRLIWQKNYVKDFSTDLPTWGIASAPLVDGDRLIALVGGKNNAGVVAFDRHTGKVIWRALSISDIGYAPPIIYTAGGVRQLIIWHPEAVVSLNPNTGAVYWQVPFHTSMGVSIITPVFDDPLLFVSQSWGGPLMLELAKNKPAAKVLWRLPPDGDADNDLLNCLMSTPILRNGYLYGISLYGEMRCLDARTGRRIWQTYQATGHGRWWNAFLIPNGDRMFIHNEQGELIIARLSPKGYDEISRAQLIEPTNRLRRRNLVWSHPAFANRCVYARNDKEIICVSLASESVQ